MYRFYKEEKVGEKHNYLHNRAFYEGGDVFDTLKATIREVVDGHRCVQTILKGKSSHLRAWNDHIMGFIAFHKSVDRYQLSELGFGEQHMENLGDITGLSDGE